MAFDKLCDSTSLDNGLTSIANAIRTKLCTSEQFSFPDDMAQAIASISVDNSIPQASIMANIDRGSFVLASETLCGDYSVNHNLGKVPKGFVIWSDDVSAFEAGNNYAMKYFCIIADSYNTSATARSYANGVLAYRASVGKAAVLSNDATTSAVASTWANSDTFALVRATTNYKANATYKWIAWA